MNFRPFLPFPELLFSNVLTALDSLHSVLDSPMRDQVIGQAADLPGLDIVKFSGGNYPPAGLAAYHDAQSVGAMNYWTYFNSSPKVEPADLVIFDDAHLAEQPLAGLLRYASIDAHRAIFITGCVIWFWPTQTYIRPLR